MKGQPRKASRSGFPKYLATIAASRIVGPTRGDKSKEARSAEEQRRIFACLVSIDLVGKMDRCELCGLPLRFELAWKRRPDPTGIYVHPLNASIDAPVPRCRGGKYTYDNTAMVHWGCNAVKIGLPKTNASTLLRPLSQGKWMVEDGFVVLTDYSRVGIAERERIFVR
ncbi:unnamed protein product [Parajaminaea phylloscopi]